MGEQVAAGNPFKLVTMIKLTATKRGCSSAGRAPALQAGGQGFESLHLQDGLIAQPVRAHA